MVFPNNLLEVNITNIPKKKKNDTIKYPQLVYVARCKQQKAVMMVFVPGSKFKSFITMQMLLIPLISGLLAVFVFIPAAHAVQKSNNFGLLRAHKTKTRYANNKAPQWSSGYSL